ncbi:loganic acid O-methyltransferase-like [Rosa rugosa]|uniref:loganic acid O-methyltransferase-like n=1 Tax=Rosa rugosa TaxID=74645 RepID=UPI002B4141FF|nr:loganic acid O-methyltransferase-like [Rosa rugosa]
MASQEIRKVTEAYPMKGGDGPDSYAKNSTYQREAMESVKELVTKGIAEKLDIDLLLPSNSFHIADLGCSVGPNTFSSVENILEAVELKFQGQGLMNPQIPEFQVFFNDHTPNDFNLLFKSLPPNRQYYAVGVPGSFYGRLFPSASIHLFHSSFALQWLSEVPKVVEDKNCPAWNKGRIHYLSSTDEVVRAYKAQYAKNMESFLHARAQELVYGGLMVLIIPGYPQGTPLSHSVAYLTLQLIEACLIDMVKKGVISEEKLDSFNIPMYSMCPQELEAVVEQNGSFSIETLETLPRVLADDAVLNAKQFAAHGRAAFEGLIKQQFGKEITNELFDLYGKKLEEELSMFKPRKTTSFLVVLKRKEK